MGKKVLLFAPGAHFKEMEVAINDFEIICAVGDFWKMQKLLIPAISDRIDVAFCGPSFFRRWCRTKINPLQNINFRTSSDHALFIPDNWKSAVSDYNFSFESACNHAGCNLTTGMSAILDVMSSEPELLYLQGFTFYQSTDPYFPGYASTSDTKLIQMTRGNISGHNQHLLLSYFKSLDRSKIQTDAQLHQILASHILS